MGIRLTEFGTVQQLSEHEQAWEDLLAEVSAMTESGENPRMVKSLTKIIQILKHQDKQIYTAKCLADESRYRR